jgi:hypothetical protein
MAAFSANKTNSAKRGLNLAAKFPIRTRTLDRQAFPGFRAAIRRMSLEIGRFVLNAHGMMPS